MKSSMRTMFVVLAIVMSFVAVQAVWAGTIDPNDTITVEGTVKSFHDPTGIVLTNATVDGEVLEDEDEEVFVGGIGPLWFWEDKSPIPAFGDTVSIEAYELVLSEDATTLIACSITLKDDEGNDVTISLRNDDGSPVWNKKPPAETTASSATTSSATGDCPCYPDCCPDCPNCTCPDCQDDCIPNEYLGPGPHGKFLGN